MKNCPACGTPESSYDGESFCGQCERKYRQGQEDYAQQQIDQLNAEIDSCCGTKEEYCVRCVYRRAQILSLQGKENEAIAYLNQ